MFFLNFGFWKLEFSNVQFNFSVGLIKFVKGLKGLVLGTAALRGLTLEFVVPVLLM